LMLYGQSLVSSLEVWALLSGGSGVVTLLILIRLLRSSRKAIDESMSDLTRIEQRAETFTSESRGSSEKFREDSTDIPVVSGSDCIFQLAERRKVVRVGE